MKRDAGKKVSLIILSSKINPMVWLVYLAPVKFVTLSLREFHDFGDVVS
jgi:hypothetical protein